MLIPKLTKPDVPITAEMRTIMQLIADNVSASRRTTTSLELSLSTYISQCAILLGIDPSLVTFDLSSATFRFKE